MKTLYLTAEQRNRLLEMAAAMYPEFEPPRFGKNWDSDEVWLSNYKYGESYRADKEPINHEIHWFQFCVHELIKKIASVIDFDFNGFLQNCVIDHKVCIVDFLYEQFKLIPNGVQA